FFRDHHRFRADELEAAAAQARAGGALALVTTAKDALRLEGPTARQIPPRLRAHEPEAAPAQARAGGALALVTTAKDAVRLEGLPALEMPVVVLHVEARIADEARLRERLLAAVRRAA